MLLCFVRCRPGACLFELQAVSTSSADLPASPVSPSPSSQIRHLLETIPTFETALREINATGLTETNRHGDDDSRRIRRVRRVDPGGEGAECRSPGAIARRVVDFLGSKTEKRMQRSKEGATC